jgi:ribosomal protein S20
MSAPGIQLNSQPQLTYVQPTLRQYLQSIKEAVMSNNLPAAQQAFAQLQKALPSQSQGSAGQTNEAATRISQGLQAVGTALEAGDLSGAEQAIGELRQNIQSASDGQAHQQKSVAEPVSSNGPEVSLEDGNSSDSGPNLNVRV